MTWVEFKDAMESKGVKDYMEIAHINVAAINLEKYGNELEVSIFIDDNNTECFTAD